MSDHDNKCEFMLAPPDMNRLGLCLCKERALKARLAEAVQYAEQLRDFAQWLTGCGYDFTQHEYFVANRHLLAARATDSATPRENV